MSSGSSRKEASAPVFFMPWMARRFEPFASSGRCSVRLKPIGRRLSELLRAEFAVEL
jgi:hypothetical protein